MQKLSIIISQQFAIKQEEVIPEMRFREELYADSLDIMELFSVLEGEFDVPQLKQEQILDINTVGDLIDLIAPYSYFYNNNADNRE